MRQQPTGAGLSPGERAYRRALLALFAVGLAAFAMVYVVQPLLPLVSAEVGVDATRASLLLSVSTFAIAVAVVPLAALAERVGRRRVMLLGLAVAVVAGTASALAPTFALMLAARTVQGAALAAVPAAALAWVAEHIEPRWTTRVAGLYIAGTTVGGMGGRVLGGVLAGVVPWQLAIVVVTAVAGLCTLAAQLLLPTGGDAVDRLGGRSAASPATGAGRSVSERDPARGGSDLRRGADAATRDADPNRSARLRLYLVAGLGMAMFVGLYNVIGYRTQAPPFLLGTGLGSMFYLTYLAGTATSSLAGRLQRRMGLRATVLLGIGACVAGVALTVPDSLVLVWLGLAVVAAGFFLVHAVSSATTARLSPRPSSGAGRYTFAYYFGSSVGGVLLGQAWELGTWGATALTAVVLLALAALAATHLPRR